MSYLEGRFVVLEYDSSRVDPGPALALFQVKNSKLVPIYNPRERCEDLDLNQCRRVASHLKSLRTSVVYTPRDFIKMPDKLLGLDLIFDDAREWGLFRSLDHNAWRRFFSDEGITLRRFDPV